MEKIKLKIIYALFIEGGINIKTLSDRIATDYKNNYNEVKKLFLDGMINITRVGNNKILALNHHNESISHYLQLNNSSRLMEYRDKHPRICARIKSKIATLFKVNPFFVYAVKGRKHFIIYPQQELKSIPKDALIFYGDGIFYSQEWNKRGT